MGWTGLKDGEILRRTKGRFDVGITMDKGFTGLQPRQLSPLSIIPLRARSNRLEDLMPLVESVRSVLSRLREGEIVQVG